MVLGTWSKINVVRCSGTRTVCPGRACNRHCSDYFQRQGTTKPHAPFESTDSKLKESLCESTYRTSLCLPFVLLHSTLANATPSRHVILVVNILLYDLCYKGYQGYNNVGLSHADHCPYGKLPGVSIADQLPSTQPFKVLFPIFTHGFTAVYPSSRLR